MQNAGKSFWRKPGETCNGAVKFFPSGGVWTNRALITETQQLRDCCRMDSVLDMMPCLFLVEVDTSVFSCVLVYDCLHIRRWYVMLPLQWTPLVQWLPSRGEVAFASVSERSPCGRGVFFGDNLPLGLSNAMCADSGTLCSHHFFPQGKERLLPEGQLPCQADNTSKLRGLQSPLSHIGTSQRALALSPLAITAYWAHQHTTNCICRRFKVRREV